MPHEHKFWNETIYLKHPRRIQQLQAPHCEAKHELSRQCVGTNYTLYYPAFHCSSIRWKIETSRVQHCHLCTQMRFDHDTTKFSKQNWFLQRL
jgi:hypothetical protein